jgi:hypothetical protein
MHSWEERPATAPSYGEARDDILAAAMVGKPKEHVPCPSCGRRFAVDRIMAHRRVCTGLSGFRAQVRAHEVCDRDEEIVQRERKAGALLVEEMRQRAEAAESRVSELSRALEAAEARAERAEQKVERSEAAAKSMEAAFDVMQEACEDGKKREAALKRRAEEAEALLKAGTVDDAEIAFIPQDV